VAHDLELGQANRQTNGRSKNIMFGKGQANRQTNGWSENIMPPPASLARWRHKNSERKKNIKTYTFLHYLANVTLSTMTHKTYTVYLRN